MYKRQGYDYTFYNEDYQEDDGGIYDNPTIYVDEAASDILEDKGYSLEDAKVVDYEDLMEMCIRDSLHTLSTDVL